MGQKVQGHLSRGYSVPGSQLGAVPWSTVSLLLTISLNTQTTKRGRRATIPFPQTPRVLGWQLDYTYKDFNGGRQQDS